MKALHHSPSPFTNESTTLPSTGRSAIRRSLVELATALALTTGVVPHIASAEPMTPTSTSANASADKGVGRQLASNGQPLAELANLSAEELGKLPLKIQAELEAWLDQKEQQGTQEAIKDRAVEQSLDQAVVSKTAEKQRSEASIAHSKETAITETHDWWVKTQPSLSTLPQSQVVSIFRKNPKGSRDILQMVVDQRFPQYEYAQKILSQL